MNRGPKAPARNDDLLVTRREGLAALAALPIAAGTAVAMPQTKDEADMPVWTDAYDPVWTEQSRRSLDSMPVGGGDIGLNLWVEDGAILFYVSRGGAFDYTGSYMKLGRMRLAFAPNPFVPGGRFHQRLHLADGHATVTGDVGGRPVEVTVWVDVAAPVVHVEVAGNAPVTMTATWETWRTADRPYTTGERPMHGFSHADGVPAPMMRGDTIDFDGDAVVAFQRADPKDETAFDLCVRTEGLAKVKDRMTDPLRDRSFGVLVDGPGLKAAGNTIGRYASADFRGWTLVSRAPAAHHRLRIVAHVAQAPTAQAFVAGLKALAQRYAGDPTRARTASRAWWRAFWERSWIRVFPDAANPGAAGWRVGRNYQLFRYQLGTNRLGRYPTKFNGGNFTTDPEYVNADMQLSPDFRRWGGSIFTAQNQRLVYWPMLKSGDVDLMAPQFDFYEAMRGNAEVRTRFYWNIDGAAFTEQTEMFGLPNAPHYGLTRRPGIEAGIEDNGYIEYLWETALEFALMILDVQRFTGADISDRMPLIEGIVAFFEDYYRKRMLQSFGTETTPEGKIVFHPGTALETYKNTIDSVVTISGLSSVLTALLALPPRYQTVAKRERYRAFLAKLPPIPMRLMRGRQVIAPARMFTRIMNVEIPQLYPVFPYQHYGVGLPDLQLARDTWTHGIENQKQKDHISWHQDAIFCARLGLTEEAKAITIRKLDDAEGRRYPTFWGPGHDWVPDHNWGGSGMIGLQEMAMQTVGDAIHLFPAWPRDWDVDIRLHAPNRTIVEASLRGGRITRAAAIPPSQQSRLVLPDWHDA